MWTRKQLKDNAKKILSKNYWKAFLVTLVLITVTGAGASGYSSMSSGISSFSSSRARSSHRSDTKITLNADKENDKDNDKDANGSEDDGSFSFKVGIDGSKKVRVTVKDNKIYVEDKEVTPGTDGTIEIDGKKINVKEYIKDDAEVFAKGFAGALVMFFVIFGFIIMIVCIIGTLIDIFVINPVRVGGYNFFNRQREGTSRFTNIFGGFAHGHYKASVRNMFLKGLYETLWSMLFIIPGIIKSYSYWMVPYITAANPNLSASRAFEISKKTMNGDKWHTFVLQLSFIGWDLLAALTFGVGYYFLAPYKETTYAELYAALKQKAIANGIATEEELAIAA